MNNISEKTKHSTVSEIKFRVNGQKLTGSEIIDYFKSQSEKYEDPETRKIYSKYAETFFVVKVEITIEDKRKISWPYFCVGLIFVISTIILGFWGFSKETLTDSQILILRLFFPLSAAFASGSFYGSMKIESKSLFKGLGISATGGCAFFILSLILFPSNLGSSFYHTIYFDESNGMIKREDLNGNIVIKLNEGPRETDIENGCAIIRNIPIFYVDKTVGFTLEINGVSLVDTNLISLKRDSQSTIRVKSSNSQSGIQSQH